MSDIIRAVKAPWTPPPSPTSLDTRPHSPPDAYRFVQNQIESAERQNERATSRTIRAQNINATPMPQERHRFSVPESINALITLIVP
jgi:hypothetical protein